MVGRVLSRVSDRWLFTVLMWRKGWLAGRLVCFVFFVGLTGDIHCAVHCGRVANVCDSIVDKDLRTGDICTVRVDLAESFGCRSLLRRDKS